MAVVEVNNHGRKLDENIKIGSVFVDRERGYICLENVNSTENVQGETNQCNIIISACNNNVKINRTYHMLEINSMNNELCDEGVEMVNHKKILINTNKKIQTNTKINKVIDEVLNTYKVAIAQNYTDLKFIKSKTQCEYNTT